MQWRYRHVVLLLAVAGNFTQLGTRLLMGPLVPEILVAFDTTKSVIGLAFTGLWAVYALTQFPSGLLGDRYGEKRIVVLAMVLAGVATVLVAASPTFPIFGLALVGLGIGTGLYFSVATSLLSRLFENQGQALSLHTAGGSAAGLIVPVVAVQISLAFGWRAAILLGAAIAFPVAALFALRVRPTEPTNPGISPLSRADPALLAELLSRPAIAYTMFLSFVGMFTFQAFSSFYPTFLVEFHGRSTSIASLAFGLVFLLSALAQPLAGRLSDLFERDGAIAASMGVTAVGYTVLLVGSGLPALVVSVGLMGLGMSWPGVLQARFMDNLGDDERALGFGLVRTVYMVIGATGSVITGTLADVAGWIPAFGVVVALLVVAVGSLLANRLR